MDSLWVSASPEGGAIVQLRSSFESSTFSELRKYSAEGSLEWSFALPSGEEGADSPVVTASGDALAWPQSGGRIHRVTANGSQSASLSIEGYSSIGRDGVASSPMGALLVLPWEPSGASIGRLLSQEGAVVVEFVGEANSSVTAGAFDLQGNVFLYVARGPVFVGARALVGPGRHLVKLSPAGELLWSTPVLEGAYDVEGERLVLGEDGTAFLLGSFHGQASWGETELTYTQVSNSGWPAYAQFALAASPNGAPQWGRLVSAYGRLATRLPGGGLALLKQSGCGGIKLVALGPDGSAQGERALAGPECGSESGQIFPTSLATAKDGAILVGGFFTGTARFGQQRAEAQGMDGFAFKASAASSN